MTLLEDPVAGSTGVISWLRELNRQWNAERPARFNVKHRDYGAKGDGTTDDTTAIQAAIDAAVAAGGGIVFFPAGTYLISAFLNVLSLIASAKYNVKLVGVSQTASVIRRKTAGTMVEIAGFYNGVVNLGFNGFADPTTASGTPTSGSPYFTCAALTQAHVGAAVTGTGIAPNSFIRAVNGTTGRLTVNATGSATVTLTFTLKGATTGVMVRGYSANTTTYSPTRQLELKNLYVQGCKEPIRFGHYSTLNGITGDTGDADIAGGSYHNIWLDNCDYGWIEDAQNTLLSKVVNLWTTGITYNHTLQPRGGQVHIDTGYLSYSLAAPETTIAAASNGVALPQATINVASIAAVNWPPVGTVKVTTSAGVQQVAYTGITGTTLTGCEGGTGTMSTGGLVESNGFPKCNVGSSNIILNDVRSENVTGTQPPVVITAPGNGTAQVTETLCYWTNGLGATNIDELMLGGSLVKTNCVTNGAVALKNTDYAGLGNDVQGGYLRYGNQTAKNEIIHDFVSTGTGPARHSGATGKLRFGNDPSVTAFSPASGVTFESPNNDNAVGIAGPVAPGIGWFISGSTVRRCVDYIVGVGTNGGLRAFQTKPDGGAIRDAMYLHDALAASDTVASLLVNIGGVYSVKRVVLGAADSAGTGFRSLRVTN